MLKTSLLRSQSVESDIVLWNSLASAANDAGRRAPISVGSQKMVEMCRIMAWRINKDPIRSYTLGIFWMTSHNLSIHSGSPKKNPVLFACGLKLERWPQAHALLLAAPAADLPAAQWTWLHMVPFFRAKPRALTPASFTTLAQRWLKGVAEWLPVICT